MDHMTDKQAQRLARILRRTAADVEAGVKASPPTDDGAIAAVNTVDVGELLEVINQWGFIVDQPMQAHAPVVEPPPVEPPVEPPPTGTLTPSPSIALKNGENNVIRNKALEGITGIAGAGDVSGNCDVADCTIKGGEYSIIISHGSSLSVVRTPMRTIGHVDNCYGIRAWMDSGPKSIKIIGDPANRTPIDNRPGFKKCLRLSGYQSLLIQHMKLIGSGWWLGNGPADNSSRPVCDNGHIADCDIYFVTDDEVKAAVELFDFVKNHTFERVNFWHLAGVSGHFAIEAWSDKPGCFGHKVIGCKVGTCNADLSPASSLRPFAWSDMRGGQAKHGSKWIIQ